MATADHSSVLRSLRVFEAFRDARRPLSLSSLAELSGEAVSTSHYVVQSLQRAGYLFSTGRRELYPTRRLLEMALAIDEHDPIAALVTPALSALRDQLGETVLLGTQQGGDTLFLMVLPGSQTIRFSAGVGETRAMHASSIGKAILAQMSDEALGKWLEAYPLTAETDRTLTSAAALRKELQASLRRGWFRTRGESVSDVMGVALPLRIAGMAYGVSVAGPIHRMRGAEKDIAQALATCVAGLQDQERKHT